MLRNSIAEIISLDLAEELFGFASSEFSAAGNIRQNELFWLDAKDKFHSTKSLKVGANGKYVKGVQGLRNSYAIAKDAAKLAKGFGKVFAFAGVVINGYDMLENGINVSNSMDVIMIAAGFIPVAGWMISGVYFIANIATEMATGQSISQHTQNWVESW
jgi:hypothetical protein